MEYCNHRKGVAIIGVACRFPGAGNYEEFWKNLLEQKSNIDIIPVSRWDINKCKNNNKQVISKWGALLSNIKRFDNNFFNITSSEACHIDPQQRILLEEVWHCLEDANIELGELQRSKTAVFIGTMATDYKQLLIDNKSTERYSCLGNYGCILANRISHFLELTGPSVTIDTACSSSLVAIHQACNSILVGESSFAIVGGVNIMCHPWKQESFSKSYMLSPTGSCRPFSKIADGYVAGEGVGVLLLAGIDIAEKLNCKIWGLIIGSSINHVGGGISPTAPSALSQADVISTAYLCANVNPDHISYLEAHGTGTSLGDPIEIEGLKQAFKDRKNICHIGSVKANIGHLEAAAGIASAIKVLLMMRYKTIVPTIGLDEPNPIISFDNIPFVFATKLLDWKTPYGCESRIAGISSFGFGGVNAHLVLKEYQDQPSKLIPVYKDLMCYPIIFSAKSLASLHILKEKIATFMRASNLCNISLQDVTNILMFSRQHFDYKGYFLIDAEKNIVIQKTNNALSKKNLKNKIILNIEDVNVSSEVIELLYENCFIFKEQLDNCILLLNKEQYDFDIQKWFRKKNESDEQYIFEFLSLYALIKSLLDNGLCIDSIIDNTKFGNLGYLLSETISLKEGISNLRRMSIEKDKLSMPKCLVYGYKYGCMLTPICVASDYFCDLLSQLIINEKDLSVLKDKVFDLYTKQHTFKNNVLEWEHALGLVDLTVADIFDKDIKDESDIIKKVFYIVSIFSMIRLYKKWELTINYNLSNAFEELFDLIEDQVLMFKEVIELILIQDVNKAASLLNDRWKRLDLKKNYLLLRKHSNFSKRVEKNDITAYVNTLDIKGENILTFSEFEPSFNNSTSFYFKFTSEVVKDFIKLVLELWCFNIGIDIKAFFGKFYFHNNKIKYTKNVTLPSYPFQGEEYWIEEQKEDAGNGAVMHIEAKETILHSSEITRSINPPTINYYKRSWIKNNLSNEVTIDRTSNKESEIKNLLLFTVGTDATEQAKELEVGIHGKVYIVKPGVSYKEIDKLNYEINPNKAEDYETLLNGLKSRGIELTGIIHNWSVVEMEIESQLSTGIYSLFKLVKELLKKKCNCRIVYSYKLGKLEVNPSGGMVGGFAKSLHQEQNKIVCKVIGFSEKIGIAEQAKAILIELFNFDGSDLEVKYTQEGRYGIKYDLYKPSKFLESNLSLLKREGVYIITGGLGGLGKIFTRYLLKEYEAKVILLGRSELTEAKKLELLELETNGGVVSYYRGDVGDKEEITRVLENIKNSYGRIDGVIHSAGVLRDKMLINKDEEEFREVLRSKVQGVINLDEALKNEELDFFVVFSSFSAEIGLCGGCDYAAANSFISEYINYRNKFKGKGKGVAIDWPHWSDGGMQSGKIEKLQFEQWMRTKQGLEPLTSKIGWQILLESLSRSSEERMVVLYGDSNRSAAILEQSLIVKLGASSLPTTIHDPNVISKNSNARKENSILKDIYVTKLQEELRLDIKELLNIPLEKILIGKSFGEMGFESMMLKVFVEKLNNRYQLDLRPTIFFANDDIKSLSNYLLTEYEDKFLGYFSKTQGDIRQNESKAELVGQAKCVDNIEVKGNYLGENMDNPSNNKENKHDLVKAFSHEDIAIIGYDGIFPGSSDPEVLWKHLEARDDLIIEIPKNRWDWREYYGDIKKHSNKMNTKWGGFIDGVDEFDPLFFGISPREAELMDPQHRLFLEVAYHTIERAGYSPGSLAESSVGVFVGLQFNDYAELLAKKSETGGTFTTGNSHSMLANRLSYFLNLHGPSEIIDTACSSSLVALRRACLSLLYGECTTALVGGVSLLLSPATFLVVSQTGVLSPDGRCKTFDASANGYVKGEGVGAILLKPLSQAIKDKDHIYGVIKGSAVNHGGKANSLTAPNAKAQRDLIIKAYQKSGIDPRTVTYIEAHGTGTELGDPVEIDGLKMSFRSLLGEEYSGEAYCGIGSVKANIGHLEPAAGIAGVVKVLLSMKHGKLPGNPHLKEVNPYINLTGSPFYLLRDTVEWKRLIDDKGNKIPRRAGVSSFGFGGTNAHVVIEEWLEEEREEGIVKPYYLIALSGKSKDVLKKREEDLLKWLEDKDNARERLADISYALLVGRDHFAYRSAFVVSSIEELIDKLHAIESGNTPEKYLMRDSTQEPEKSPIYEELAEKIIAELQGVLDTAIYGKKLLALGDLYVRGYELNLECLYDIEHFKKLSLPGYPFENKKYWVETGNTDLLQPQPLDIDKTDEGKIKRYIEIHLLDQLNKILKIDISTFDKNKSFAEYGINSIVGISFLSTINSALGINLNLASLLKNRTLEALTDYIYKTYPNVISIHAIADKTAVKNENILYAENLNSIHLRDIIKDVSKTRVEFLSFKYVIEYGNYLLLRFFKENGVFLKRNEKYTLDELYKHFAVIPQYFNLFKEFLKILSVAGYLEFDNNISTTALVEHKNVIEKILHIKRAEENLKDLYPQFYNHINLLTICGDAYPSLLNGSLIYTEVLFPHGSFDLINKIYEGNIIVDGYNLVVAKLAQDYLIESLGKNPLTRVNILEIGAGVGATSKIVLSNIKQFSSNIIYYYTDISQGFTDYANEYLLPQYPFLRTGIYNVEVPPQEMGYSSGSIDIVIATNVLHATKNLNLSINNIRSLLKSNGILIINELAEKNDFLTLTFGLASGWWFAEDKDNRIPGTPLVNKEKWISLLEKANFSNIQAFYFSGEDRIATTIILAKNIIQSNKGLIENSKNVCSHDEYYIKNQLQKIIALEINNIMKIDINTLNPSTTFIEYGINSLTGVSLISAINQKLGIDLKLFVLIQTKNLKNLVETIYHDYRNIIDSKIREQENVMAPEEEKSVVKLINGQENNVVQQYKEVVKFNAIGSKPPIFFIHAGNGLVYDATNLFYCLGTDYPFYGIQARGVDGLEQPHNSMQDIVEDYIKYIKSIQPYGPYYLSGYCYGGIIAFAIASILKKEMGHLFILDSLPVTMQNCEKMQDFLRKDYVSICCFAANAFLDINNRVKPESLDTLPTYLYIDYLVKYILENSQLKKTSKEVYLLLRGMISCMERVPYILSNYIPTIVDYDASDVTFFSAVNGYSDGSTGVPKMDPYDRPFEEYWQKSIKSKLEIVECHCDHLSILLPPFAEVIAKNIKLKLAKDNL